MLSDVNPPDHYKRIYRLPRQSFFLLGPRGTGKSTWAKISLPEAHRIDLLDESLYQSYLVNPDLFAAEMRARPAGSWVVVDEIQRIPTLLNLVHHFIEEKRLRFALLGSSARKLKAAGTNLLAGRAIMKMMYPLVPEELGADFSLEPTLQWGTLAVVLRSEAKKEALQAYAQLYLREEIKAEALVRNLAGFARFLPVAALFHGQLLNAASLARDAGVSRTTVLGYLDILEDTLLGYRLPAFEARLRVRERRHPKFYWIDPGIPRAIRRELGAPTAQERGPLFEGFIGMLLRLYMAERNLADEIYYWAPAEARNCEVDFLLRRGREFVAIEVKATDKPASLNLSGLKAIAVLPGLTRRVLIYAGKRELQSIDGSEIWPLGKFLEALAGDKLWP